MAYTKQTWKTGEVITEEKLNHMEDGIAGASGEQSVVICGINCGDYAAPDNQRHSVVSEYTFDEIVGMLSNDVPVMAHIYSDDGSVHEYILFKFTSGLLDAARTYVVYVSSNNTLIISRISLSNLYPGDKSLGLTRFQDVVQLSS